MSTILLKKKCENSLPRERNSILLITVVVIIKVTFE